MIEVENCSLPHSSWLKQHCARLQARPGSMSSSRPERRSTMNSKTFLTRRPTPGGLRSRRSNSSTSTFRGACSARWPSRPKPSVSAARRSSQPTVKVQGFDEANRGRCKDGDGAVSIQLRFLQTLTEVAVEKNSTMVLPVRSSFFGPLRPTPRPGAMWRAKSTPSPTPTPRTSTFRQPAERTPR